MASNREKRINNLLNSNDARSKNELGVLAQGQAEVLAMQQEKENNINMQRTQSQMRLQNMQTLQQASEGMLAMENGNQQPQVASQVGRMNQSTQSIMNKYGIRPQNTRTMTTNNQRMQSGVGTTNVRNEYITNNKTDVRITQPQIPVSQPQIVYSNGNKQSSDNTAKFKAWMSQMFAKQQQDSEIQAKEFRKREWSLGRTTEKLMKRIETSSKNMYNRLNPENLVSTAGGQFKWMMIMFGAILFAKFFKPAMRVLTNLEGGFRAVFGIPINEDLQHNAGEGLRFVDKLKKDLFGLDPNKRDQSLIGGIKDIVTSGFDKLIDKLKFWFEDRSNAIKELKFPDLNVDFKGSGVIGRAMSPLMSQLGESLRGIGQYLGDIITVALGGSKGRVAVASRKVQRAANESMLDTEGLQTSMGDNGIARGNGRSYMRKSDFNALGMLNSDATSTHAQSKTVSRMLKDTSNQDYSGEIATGLQNLFDVAKRKGSVVVDLEMLKSLGLTKADILKLQSSKQLYNAPYKVIRVHATQEDLQEGGQWSTGWQEGMGTALGVTAAIGKEAALIAGSGGVGGIVSAAKTAYSTAKGVKAVRAAKVAAKGAKFGAKHLVKDGWAYAAGNWVGQGIGSAIDNRINESRMENTMVSKIVPADSPEQSEDGSPAKVIQLPTLTESGADAVAARFMGNAQNKDFEVANKEFVDKIRAATHSYKKSHGVSGPIVSGISEEMNELYSRQQDYSNYQKRYDWNFNSTDPNSINQQKYQPINNFLTTTEENINKVRMFAADMMTKGADYLRSEHVTSEDIRRRYIYTINRLTAAGLSESQAAGIAGNLMRESGLRANLSKRTDSNGELSGGIAQWNGPRLEAIERYFGQDITQIPFDKQLDYLIEEMKGNAGSWRTSPATKGLFSNTAGPGSTVFEYMRSLGDNVSPEDAAVAFERAFEVSGDYKGNRDKQRREFAVQAYNLYKNTSETDVNTVVTNFSSTPGAKLSRYEHVYNNGGQSYRYNDVGENYEQQEGYYTNYSSVIQPSQLSGGGGSSSRILWIGDSHSAAFNGVFPRKALSVIKTKFGSGCETEYAYKPSLKTLDLLENCGLTSASGPTDLATVTGKNPSIIIIQLGESDAAESLSNAEENIKEVVKKLQTSSNTLIWITPWGYSRYFSRQWKLDPTINDKVNSFRVTLKSSNAGIIVDIAPKIGFLREQAKPTIWDTFIGNDGHLFKKEGYEYLGEILGNILSGTEPSKELIEKTEGKQDSLHLKEKLADALNKAASFVRGDSGEEEEQVVLNGFTSANISDEAAEKLEILQKVYTSKGELNRQILINQGFKSDESGGLYRTTYSGGKEFRVYADINSVEGYEEFNKENTKFVQVKGNDGQFHGDITQTEYNNAVTSAIYDLRDDYESKLNKQRTETTSGDLTLNGKLFILSLGRFNDYQGYDERLIQDIIAYTNEHYGQTSQTELSNSIAFYVVPTADLKSFSVIYASPIEATYFIGFRYYGKFITSDRMQIFKKGYDWSKEFNDTSVTKMIYEFSTAKNPGYYPPAWVTKFRLTPKALSTLESILEVLRMAKGLKGGWNVAHGDNNLESFVTLDGGESKISDSTKEILYRSFEFSNVSKSALSDYLSKNYKKNFASSVDDKKVVLSDYGIGDDLKKYYSEHRDTFVEINDGQLVHAPTGLVFGNKDDSGNYSFLQNLEESITKTGDEDKSNRKKASRKLHADAFTNLGVLDQNSVAEARKYASGRYNHSSLIEKKIKSSKTIRIPRSNVFAQLRYDVNRNGRISDIVIEKFFRSGNKGEKLEQIEVTQLKEFAKNNNIKLNKDENMVFDNVSSFEEKLKGPIIKWLFDNGLGSYSYMGDYAYNDYWFTHVFRGNDSVNILVKKLKEAHANHLIEKMFFDNNTGSIAYRISGDPVIKHLDLSDTSLVSANIDQSILDDAVKVHNDNVKTFQKEHFMSNYSKMDLKSNLDAIFEKNKDNMGNLLHKDGYVYDNMGNAFATYTEKDGVKSYKVLTADQAYSEFVLKNNGVIDQDKVGMYKEMFSNGKGKVKVDKNGDIYLSSSSNGQQYVKINSAAGVNTNIDRVVTDDLYEFRDGEMQKIEDSSKEDREMIIKDLKNAVKDLDLNSVLLSKMHKDQVEAARTEAEKQDQQLKASIDQWKESKMQTLYQEIMARKAVQDVTEETDEEIADYFIQEKKKIEKEADDKLQEAREQQFGKPAAKLKKIDDFTKSDKYKKNGMFLATDTRGNVYPVFSDNAEGQNHYVKVNGGWQVKYRNVESGSYNYQIFRSKAQTAEDMIKELQATSAIAQQRVRNPIVSNSGNTTNNTYNIKSDGNGEQGPSSATAEAKAPASQ